MDVEDRASGGAARNQRTARAARPPVKLTMTSEDVIHDFFVPAFRVKKDVLPGRYTSLWFEATKTGNVSSVLRAVLRRIPCGMIGSVSSWSRTNTGAGSPAESQGESMEPAGEKCFSRTAAPPAILPMAPARAVVARRLWTTGQTDDGRDRHGGRCLHARVDPDSQAESRSGLHAHHAFVPGTTDGRADLNLIAYIAVAGQVQAKPKEEGKQ